MQLQSQQELIQFKKIISMIQTVIKRDGRIVGFNEEKISTAMIGAENHASRYNERFFNDGIGRNYY